METKEQYTTTFHLSNYLVRHSIVLPSKFSDYDYDDTNPDRRFLSEIFHKLDFSDPIIGIQQCSILFTSDTSSKLCDALYHMNDNLGLDNNDATRKAPILVTINDVYVNSFINRRNIKWLNSCFLLKMPEKNCFLVLSKFQKP